MIIVSFWRYTGTKDGLVIFFYIIVIFCNNALEKGSFALILVNFQEITRKTSLFVEYSIGYELLK